MRRPGVVCLRAWRLVLACTVLAALLVGCSGDDSAESGPQVSADAKEENHENSDAEVDRVGDAADASSASETSIDASTDAIGASEASADRGMGESGESAADVSVDSSEPDASAEVGAPEADAVGEAGSGEAGSDAAEAEAGSPPCVEGAACVIGPDLGLCMAGACSLCTDIADDSSCVAAYGAAYRCVARTCVRAQCRANTDCSGIARCIDNACVPGGCRDDDDCLDSPDHVCDVPSGACVSALIACTGHLTGEACGGAGSGDHCCGPSCKAVECCSDAGCPSGQTCVLGTCGSTTSCGVTSNHTYYVDAAAGGGNGQTGSTLCPFKNLRRALSTISANQENVANSVTVVIRSQINEANQGTGTFPISVPSRVLVKGESNAARPLVTVPANTTGFIFSYAKPSGTTALGGLSQLTIDQAAPATDSTTGAGIWIKGTSAGDLGTTSSIDISRVGIHRFNHGIRVDERGYAAIGAAVSAVNNNMGLYVTDGYVKVVVPVGSTACHFDANNRFGIYVGGASILDARSDQINSDASTVTKLITADSNVFGIRFDSTVATDPLLLQELLGIEADDNADTGIVVYAGNTLKIRYAEVRRDRTGLVLLANGSNNDLGSIDLGDIDDYGYNYFANNSAAVCIATSFDGSILHMNGNIFAAGSRDCSAGSSQLSWAPVCTGANIGFTQWPSGASKWRIEIANCTHLTW